MTDTRTRVYVLSHEGGFYSVGVLSVWSSAALAWAEARRLWAIDKGAGDDGAYYVRECVLDPEPRP